MKLRNRLLRIGMRSVGRLSDGIRLGYRSGFDSGSMLDYVYANRPSGITPLGRAIDRAFLNDRVWRGVRARRELLVVHLSRALAAVGPGARLFDTAAGQASYLFALPPGQSLAGDRSEDEVKRGNERATAAGRGDIRFVIADAFDASTWPGTPFDVLVSSGFFDILTDEADVERVLDAGAAGTRPGARWVLTVMERHPRLDLLREVLVDFEGRPWVAVARSIEEVMRLAETRGWQLDSVDRESHGFFAVATLVRI
jgi:ubiquinone/menaquinone biosynthesis C-methylase UbiE